MRKRLAFAQGGTTERANVAGSGDRFAAGVATAIRMVGRKSMRRSACTAG